jgi:hypothetical protein
MIAPDHPLPVAAQCRLLDISRGCVYYQPVPISEADLRLMRRIDELHLEYPYFGSRRLQVKLREDGLAVGRRHLVTLPSASSGQGCGAWASRPCTASRARRWVIDSIRFTRICSKMSR